MSNVVQFPKFPPKIETSPTKLREQLETMSDLVSSIGIGPVALPYLAHMAFMCSSQPRLILDLMNRNLSPSQIAEILIEMSVREVEDGALDEELRDAGLNPDELRALARVEYDEDRPLS